VHDPTVEQHGPLRGAGPEPLQELAHEILAAARAEGADDDGEQQLSPLRGGGPHVGLGDFRRGHVSEGGEQFGTGEAGPDIGGTDRYRREVLGQSAECRLEVGIPLPTRTGGRRSRGHQRHDGHDDREQGRRRVQGHSGRNDTSVPLAGTVFRPTPSGADGRELSCQIRQ
jgi:hypothetical protein